VKLPILIIASNKCRFCTSNRAILALGLVLVLSTTSCGKKNASSAQSSQAVPVHVVRVRLGDAPLNGNWVGTLDGFVNAQIQPQVSGYLTEQEYREGAAVGRGQILFEIDPRPFQAAVDQSEAQVKQAKGQLAQA
jgi:membrane fusion protein (multidrug efflux system)